MFFKVVVFVLTLSTKLRFINKIKTLNYIANYFITIKLYTITYTITI